MKYWRNVALSVCLLANTAVFAQVTGRVSGTVQDPSGSSVPNAKVELVLSYEIATELLERVVGPVFSHIANTLIDSFVRRAEAVYAKAAR